MSEPGGPRQRGRHSSADDGSAGVPTPPWAARREPGPAMPYGIPAQAGQPTDDFRVPAYLPSPAGRATGGFRPVSGVLDRFGERTGPVAEPEWWSYGSTDHPSHPLSARHRGTDDREPGGWNPEPDRQQPGSAPREHYHPSAPLPPLPSGVWDRLRPRDSELYSRGDGVYDERAYDERAYDDRAYDDEVFDEDAATVAHPRLGRPTGQAPSDEDVRAGVPPFPVEDDRTDAHRFDQDGWEDRTGGLEVIGAHVGNDGSRGRRWRRSRRDDRRDAGVDPAPETDLGSGLSADDHALAGGHGDTGYVPDQHGVDDHPYDDHPFDDHPFDDHPFDGHPFDDHGDTGRGHDEPAFDAHLPDDDIPVAPYDARSGRRRRRRRIAVLLSLLVLAGIVAGIVVGGGKLLTMINPASRDFTGQGTGTAQVRINQGDTLSDIGQILVDGGVIASVGPFVDAAEADPDAAGIQPGVYRLREKMSGKAAVSLLLDPASRLVTRITLREGLTVKATLAKLAEATGTPIAEFNAAAADPAALGLPDYARGKLEGFLFPATYDFEPDTTPADMLKQMVDRALHAFDDLQIAPADRLTVLTKASLVQAEASSTEDMAKVARVLENRMADGMPLQLDTTVNYANGKTGITTSAADRKNPSPYNTYVHPGLPPGAIDNPGEEALRAVLSPAPGDWRFFVVVNPDTGETRFAKTGAEHQQNVLLFQQWLREHPGG